MVLPHVNPFIFHFDFLLYFMAIFHKIYFKSFIYSSTHPATHLSIQERIYWVPTTIMSSNYGDTAVNKIACLCSRVVYILWRQSNNK